MMNNIPLEEHESIAFADWLRIAKYEFTHVGNESGQRGSANIVRMMAKKKKMGVSKGFPDFTIVLKRNALLFIEMKRKSRTLSKESKEQQKWIKILSSIPNCEAEFAYGCEEAIKIVEMCEEK